MLVNWCYIVSVSDAMLCRTLICLYYGNKI